jgi:RNA polymerase sigma-70 factor, ECF subfamily
VIRLDGKTQELRGEERHALFDRIFREHASYVQASLRRLGVRAAEVHDLSQDVFVAVHDALERFDTSRPVRPWLFAFCFRVASNHRRSSRVRAATTDVDELEDPLVDPEHGAAARQLRARLLRALATLPEEQRAVIILHEMDQETTGDIAEALGIPVGTVRSRIRLGRKALERFLRGETNGGERA